jgi:phospholipase C
MPVQEPGRRPHRPSQFMPHADVTINRSAYTATATMSNTGQIGVSLLVYPDKFQPPSATPFTVVNGADKTYTWTAAAGDKYGYAFTIYGPDGFVRSFAGDIVPASTATGQIPQVAATQEAGYGRSLRLTLANEGTTAVTYTLTANDHAGDTHTVTVDANGSTNVTWPVDADGYYDVIITANTSDGFTRRYAGRIA